MVAPIEIHLAQQAFLVGDIEANVRKILAGIEQARAAGADVLVFPELAVTGYPPEDLLLRGDFIRQSDGAVARIVEASQGIDVVFGAPRHDGRTLYNSAFWARDGRLRGVYDKFILPNYAVFDEKRYFSEGSQPIVLDIKGIKLGLSVCEDIWYREPAVASRAAGANALLILNASPYHCGKHAERLAVLHQRHAETGLALFYLNLVGGQDELVFDGQSLVLDGRGELAGRGADFHEQTLRYRLHANGRVDALQQPALAPVSPDDASIYQALVTGVHDYVNNNGFAGVVLGLSGGVDSALTLAIAVDALGADKVLAVMMPSRYTADISQLDAEAEARALGVEYRVIPIEPAFNTFLELLQPAFAGMAPDTTEENIQARCRGILLMALSNKLQRMVLTTGNKSEMAVGYCTLYGDMAGGFAPLKDVFKMRVYSLSRYRNSLSPVIPERVLTRAPSAELKPDQTDQDSLPPYEILDAILAMTVEDDKSHEDIIAAGYNAQIVARVKRMVQINEYKRRQAPPGVRITRRAFGRDRRYPITSGYRRK
jgi:NAD+ synthase (glutamine-hydrolysing)